MRICVLIAALFLCAGSSAPTKMSVVIGYLRAEVAAPPTLSNLDPDPEDLAIAGARLGLDDNVTTGKFLGHVFTLSEHVVGEGEDPLPAARKALSLARIVVLDAPAETLLAIADLPEARGAVLFNATAPGNALRSGDCRANLLHTLPSHAMRADALSQFLVSRRWPEVALIAGTYAQDVAFADAIRHSLTKFGLRLRGEKTWAFDADMRRNASQEVPLFTQDFPDHQMLVVADETHDFGRYVAYNSWLPRPVGGSEGIVPEGWSPAVEQWGAAQLQSRFEQAAGRKMRSEDFAAWAAVRAVGEAVTRTNSGDVAVLREFMLSESFELAGFKGRPLSFRDWNGQMRQPIPLATERAVVATAPLEGFLHQWNELDTLGLDRPESACTAFGD